MAVRIDVLTLSDLERLVREDVDDRRPRRKVEREPDRDGAMVRVGSDRDGEDAGEREQELDPAIVVGCKRLSESLCFARAIPGAY